MINENEATENENMTIEQLSMKTGISTRNIRAYQSRDLLPPPETRGRVGYYNDGHLARLRLISGMQKRGFSLAAISELFSAWEKGRGLRELIGFETELTAAWDKKHLYTISELRAMFDDDSIPYREFLEGAASLGLLEKRGHRYAVDHPKAMRMGVEALRAGIPIEVALQEADHAMKSARDVAERLVREYTHYVWEPFVEAGMPSDQLDEVTDYLHRLRLYAGDMMSGLLMDALGRELEERAASELEKSSSASHLREMTEKAGL